MKRKSQRKSLLVLPIILLLVAAALLVFGSTLFTTEESPHYNQLSSGWSVSRGGETYEDVTIADLSLGLLKKDEVITIKRSIPPTDIQNPTILFKTVFSTVVVRIDGDIVYTYGLDNYEKGKYIPKKYHMLPIKNGNVEHEIEITLTVSEGRAYKAIYPVYYGTKRELLRTFFQYRRLAIFVGGFFVIYACLFVSLGLFLSLNGRGSKSVFMTAALSMVLGVFTFCYNDTLCFISDNDDFFIIAEYGALYLIPIMISFLFYSVHPEIARVRQRIIIVINIIIPIVAWVLHIRGIAHLNLFVLPMQVISVIEMVGMLPVLIKGIRKEYKTRKESVTYTGIQADNYLLLGFAIMISFTILEILMFNASNYIKGIKVVSLFARVSFMNLGMMCFIICLFVYYFLNGIDHMNESKVKNELEGIAYTDALTGLMNRAKCMQYGETLEGDYALVSLDLDKLKYVNDTFGHNEGDRMLKAFADILVDSFIGANIIGRLGGDEFIVIFEKPSKDVCDKCISLMQKNIQAFNEKKEKFTLSASAGYAYSKEADTIDDVYFLADSRMYEMKEKHHA
ncbi:GGDEF domain-containing protein [Butyrivibrio proteoclasticus]|uniref:GGDEF domain-containing protein n=1 Tax=Butyrivibrio proteoclasticus TaxID=43305 RepID=UPI000479987B|nr:GGDEF domain-containing protein [Butyrivibrio proteoclasticus]